MTTTTARSIHPSARLYNGEVTDARDAIETRVRALRFELGELKRMMAGWPEDDIEAAQFNEAEWRGWINSAERCLAEYDAKIGAAEHALFAEWAKSDDVERQAIGQAGVDLNWQQLSI